MYEAFFGLQKRPFPAVPRTDQYFPGKAIEAARQTLARCIQRAEGPGLVIGPAGTGKTLLCQLLAEQFKDSFAVAHLSAGGLTTRRGLLQAILFELGQPYRGMDDGELRLALVDFATTGAGCAQGMVLLVDEAHTLPLRLLEEIRVVANLVVGGQARTRLVLAGAPPLEERLASPRLDSFSQRLAARCYLEAMNRTETQAYIHAAIEGAGGRAEEILAPDACQAVYQATNGVPRLINQVCDHALLLAYAAGRPEVAAACIQEAWADLQQLPTPWSDERGADRGSGVIEFGRLDDEPAPAADAPALNDPLQQDDPSVVCVTRGPEELLPEPIERLERIEQALNALEEDFQPAGSIGPEVELVFDEPNPFSEPFEEEEVLVDRFAPIGSFPARPQAASPGNAAEVDPAGIQRAYVAENVYCVPTPQMQVAVWTVPSPETPNTAAVSPGDAATPGREELPETLPLRREPAAESSQTDDADMIVIEEGYEPIEPPHVRPEAAVRKQEYGQLFSRLRRGR